MRDVIEARAPSGTHTDKRLWAPTETPKQVPGQSKLSEWDLVVSQVGILKFVYAEKEHSTAPSRVGPFLVSSTQDQADAILEPPGAELSDRIRRALPDLAPVAPGEEFPPPEVVERLLSWDALIAAQRMRYSASIQVDLSADKWMAQVRAWASSFPQRGHVVDDSRESIYGDRV